jgi:hypothetical protein
MKQTLAEGRLTAAIRLEFNAPGSASGHFSF